MIVSGSLIQMNGAFSPPLTGIHFGNKEAFPTRLCTELHQQRLQGQESPLSQLSAALWCAVRPGTGCLYVFIPL